MIKSCSGWILDICIENDETILWIKKEDGGAIRLVDEYEPTLYILPKSDRDGAELFQILSDLLVVKEVKWEYKYIDISNGDKKNKLLLISTFSIFHYNRLLKILENAILKKRIRQLFNTRISHLQKYLFTQLKTQPASKVRIEYEGINLVSIERINDEQEIDLAFSTMHVDIIPRTEQTTSFDYDDPVKSIKVQYQFRTLNFEDNESAFLQNLCSYVVSQDPDIIIFSNSDLEVLPYLFERVKRLPLDVQLGRRKTDLYNKHSGNILEKWIQGRIYVPGNYYNNESIVGLIELSRFSFLPIRACLKYDIGHLIASRNCRELLMKNYVLAENNQSQEPVRILADIVDKDKGGMIISPRVGLHENVAVLDFDNEFANIIVNSNIGYEASDNHSEPKILPSIVKHLIQRRVYFKQLVTQLPQDSIEANLCKERADTIKRILVCVYGTTGSFWNNFEVFKLLKKLTEWLEKYY